MANRFRKLRRSETTASVFAFPAWKVKQLTGREKSRHGDVYAPIKYKDNLGKLTKRIKIVSRTEYRKRYTAEKFGETLSLRTAAQRRREGTLGYTSRAAENQAKKTAIGRKINAALSKPEPARLETPQGAGKNSGNVYPLPARFTSQYRRTLLHNALFKGAKIDDGDWHELRDYLSTIDAQELYNMIDGRHYRRPEAAVML